MQKALVFVSRCQNLESEHNTTPFAAKVNDGGFYYTIAAGGQSQAGNTPDGGLRSYGSMTYAGLKSMIYAGVSQDDPRVKAAYEWIQRTLHARRKPRHGRQRAVLLLPHVRQSARRDRRRPARRRRRQIARLARRARRSSWPASSKKTAAGSTPTPAGSKATRISSRPTRCSRCRTASQENGRRIAARRSHRPAAAHRRGSARQSAWIGARSRKGRTHVTRLHADSDPSCLSHARKYATAFSISAIGSADSRRSIVTQPR